MLRCTAAWHRPGSRIAEFEKVTRKLTFPVGAGLSGRVWESGRPAWIADVARDKNFAQAALADRVGLHGAFGFPILLRDQVVAVMVFFSPVIQKPDRPLLQMFGTIGSQIGQFIQRRRAERRLATQYAVTAVLSEAANLESALPRILQNACATLGWGFGAFLEVDAAAGLLRCSSTFVAPGASVGALEKLTRRMTFVPGAGVAGRVWATGEPTWIPDVVQDDNFANVAFADQVGLHSAFAFPVLLGKETLGVIEFFSNEIRPPDTDLLQMCRAIGSQIGQFINRKRVEQALTDSESQHRLLFERNPYPIWAFDAETLSFVAVNQAAIDHYGFSREEFLSMKVWDIRPPEEREAIMDRVTRRIGEIEKGAVWRHRKKDGTVIEVEITSQGLTLGGRAVRLVIANDVTQRRRAELALQESEARTRSIIENMLGGLITADATGVIESINPAAEKIFGYSRRELTGQHMTLLLPESAGSDPESFMRSAYQRAIGHVSEWEGKRRNGERFPMQLSLFEFQTREGRHFAGHVMDLSELREVERLKKEFVSIVSHELRTPLTSIRGSLSLLKAGALGDLPEEAREVVDIAERNTVRLITLINDILDLERLESGKMEMHFDTVPLSNVLDRAVEAIRAFADQHQVTLLVNPSPVQVYADQDRLVQVLVNLLSNAVKFSPEGSPVEIATTVGPGWVEVMVKDQGRGIPPDMRTAIFERFRQVETSDARQKEGSGLGLAISKTIIEQHQGSIGLESEEGRGSVFWFRVPSAAKSQKAVAMQAIRSILICAVDPETRLYLADLLRREEQEYNVAIASTLEEAWKTLQSIHVSVAILDSSLFRNSASNLLQQIRSTPKLANLPVVLVGDGVVLSQASLSDNLAMFISKPIEENTLLAAIHEVLAKTGPGDVLLVEDDEALLGVMARQLGQSGIGVRTATTGKEAILLAGLEVPGLLVLDIALPEGDGFYVVDALRESPELRKIPLLVYTGLDLTHEQRVRLKLGPTRFLTKSRGSDEEFQLLVMDLLRPAERKKPEGSP